MDKPEQAPVLKLQERGTGMRAIVDKVAISTFVTSDDQIFPMLLAHQIDCFEQL
jgi:hypothetical protein